MLIAKIKLVQLIVINKLVIDKKNIFDLLLKISKNSLIFFKDNIIKNRSIKDQTAR